MASATRLNVPRTEWRTFFDRMSTGLLGKWAEVEVASLDLGDQIVAEWVPLLGITYDSNDDRLEVALDRTTHAILHPKEILVEQNEGGVTQVDVVDSEGTRQVVRLKDPLVLPSSTSPRA
jgi:uncharacterized protein DUF5335